MAINSALKGAVSRLTSGVRSGRSVQPSARASFHSDHYLRHNARRQEHLASLRIPLAGSSVLEVGAGIGDHSHYFLDRGCDLTISEPRAENLEVLRSRFPNVKVVSLDLDEPQHVAASDRFDLTYCYGVLYHLNDPETALQTLSDSTRHTLLLSTAVSFGDEEAINLVSEYELDPTQAISGTGCRPTRPWIRTQLRKRFEHVYMPLTQPNHAEFPLDWAARGADAGLNRAVFVAARSPIDNDVLTEDLPMVQTRHE